MDKKRCEGMASENVTKLIIQQPQRNRVATLSLFFGVFGFLLGIIPVIGWLAIPMLLLSFVLGLVGLLGKVNKVAAFSGIMLSTLMIAYKLWFVQFFLL